MDTTTETQHLIPGLNAILGHLQLELVALVARGSQIPEQEVVLRLLIHTLEELVKDLRTATRFALSRAFKTVDLLEMIIDLLRPIDRDDHKSHWTGLLNGAVNLLRTEWVSHQIAIESTDGPLMIEG